MKQLLKIALFAAFCVATTTAFSQISFGAKAGLNLANISLSGDGSSLINTKILPTFQIGAIVEYGITENLAIQSGVSLQGKGFKIDDDLLGSSKSNPLYVQIPAHLLYKADMFFVGVGPYVGFGVAGKAEYDGESESLTFGSDDASDYSALDFGIGAQLGVNIGAIRIGAGYDLGLSDIVPKDLRGDGISAKHGVINVFAAYMFGK